MATLVIGMKPGNGDPAQDPSGTIPDDGQEIADAAQALPPDDLAKLFSGISPDALTVMEQIPGLKAFADFLKNGGKDDQSAPDDTPPPPPTDLRSQIAGAVKKAAPQGAGY